MSDEHANQWIEWNNQGFIPGPEESESAYIERIKYCKNLREELVKKAGADLPFDMDDHTSKEFLEEAFPITQELYGIQPRWVPLFFSNHQLTPWHGGCAWIFQFDDQTPTAAFLQLRSNFRTSSTYLGLYHREELIAHELAHVGRMLYQEPQFEEILAYQTSSSTWRRWLGPIVQSSKETLLFILLLGVVIMADLATVSLGHGFASSMMWWLKLAPCLLIGLAIGRLAYRHYLYNQCLQRLETLYSHPSTARHLLYRLTDDEIRQFANLPLDEIRSEMHSFQQFSFRWQFLLRIYPLPE